MENWRCELRKWEIVAELTYMLAGGFFMECYPLVNNFLNEMAENFPNSFTKGVKRFKHKENTTIFNM